MKRMSLYQRDIGINKKNMYKIPDYFKISCIKNNVISQIAFGINFITLFFNKGFIQFSGSFSVQFNNQRFDYDEVYPVQNDYGLLKLLLEKEIVNVLTNERRNSLVLEFDGKIILELNGNEEYESFRLNLDGFEIIV